MDTFSSLETANVLGRKGSILVCGRTFIARDEYFLVVDFCLGFSSKNFVILFTFLNSLAGLGFVMADTAQDKLELQTGLSCGRGKIRLDYTVYMYRDWTSYFTQKNCDLLNFLLA